MNVLYKSNSKSQRSRSFDSGDSREVGKHRATIYLHLNPKLKERDAKNKRERRQRFKEQLVLEHGGRCLSCGYDRDHSALDFHHLESTEKELKLSNQSNSSYKKLYEESLKCILLCSNCHREIHSGSILLIS